MADTSIEWTDKTWNPVRGCSLVSQGCKNCYAMRQAHRFSGKGQPYEGLTVLNSTGPTWTGKVVCDESKLDEPLHWKRPCRVFVNSMSDLFHEDVPDTFLMSVFSTMCAAKRHIFQILTKRPGRMKSFLSQWATMTRDFGPLWPNTWPQNHIWLGVSVEDQKTADERVPIILQTPAAVRWVSYEPALGPVYFTNFQIMGHSLDALRGEWCSNRTTCLVDDKGDECLDWLVCGGESGPGARPMHPDWARSVRDQCVAAGVPFFFKQWGRWKDGSAKGNRLCVYADGRSCEFTQEAILAEERRSGLAHNESQSSVMTAVGKKAAGRLLDGCEWNEYPALEAAIQKAGGKR